MQAAETEDLVRRARGGDEGAFTKLLVRHRAALRGAVRRMIGHPDDTDDVEQESALDAWQSLSGFDGALPFERWLCAIGVRQAALHLRGRTRWRPEAQVVHQNACAEEPELAGEVIETLGDPDFRYSVDEHVAYCFTCVGRSLDPDEQAAIVLCDVLGVAPRDAADALGADEAALRRRVAAARGAMQRTFDGICTLTSPKGSCYQCRGLRNGAPLARQGAEPPEITSLDQRLAIVRGADVDHGESQLLHDLFWRRTDRLEELGR